jgi:hypothetical protein
MSPTQMILDKIKYPPDEVDSEAYEYQCQNDAWYCCPEACGTLNLVATDNKDD